MAASQRLTLGAEGMSFLADTGDVILIEETRTDRSKFSLKKGEGGWLWKGLAPGVTCEIGGKKRTDRAELEDKADIRFHRYYIAAYPAMDKLTLIVFDPTREELRRFNHLLYFDPDPAYALESVLTLFEKPEPLTMLTSQNLEKTFYRWGKIEFQLGGKNYELTALKYSLSSGPEGRILFIPFNDATNGDETYGAGRYLEIHEPEGDTFILDFNGCFNPLCNYSPAYNCPIPPAENRLDVAIRAGEKTYPH
jgi:uncharacterized protein (DUF1684 family)